MPNYEDLLREYQANQQLEKSGSVMSSSKVGEMERRKSQGPLLSTVMDVLSGGFDPLNVSLGGAGKAASISPAGWKAMAPEAKAMLNSVFDKFPKLMKQVLGESHPLMASVGSSGAPGALASLYTQRPMTSMAKAIGKPEMSEKPINAILSILEGEAKGLDTPVHELEHYKQFNKVAKTDPADAGTIGMLLSDVLPKKGQSSLLMRKDQFENIAPYGLHDPLELLAHPAVGKDIVDKSQLARGAEYSKQIAGGEGYYKPGETTGDFLQRAMMDEGFAHLAERTTHASGDPTLMTLAEKLGVGTGLKSYIPGE